MNLGMEPKIVFAGPPNAGKTTAIRALSDVPPIVTDVDNNDPSLAKEATTVGFDYGVVHLDGGSRYACTEPRVRSASTSCGRFWSATRSAS